MDRLPGWEQEGPPPHTHVAPGMGGAWGSQEGQPDQISLPGEMFPWLLWGMGPITAAPTSLSQKHPQACWLLYIQ